MRLKGSIRGRNGTEKELVCAKAGHAAWTKVRIHAVAAVAAWAFRFQASGFEGVVV